MTTGPQIDFEKHNSAQRHYFERSLKRTMLPADSPYLRRQVDELVRFAGIRNDESLLEVGCGMGRYTLKLAERGLRIEGLDLTPRLLERLREFNAARYDIPLYCADVMNPPPELNERFDVVLGFFTLHHLHDLKPCFRAMKRLLKPSGRVVFLEPNPYNPLYYLQVMLTPGMTWEGDRGIVRMRRRVIFDAMQSAGLVHPALLRFGFFPPALANMRRVQTIERRLESFPLWRAALPFQLFRGELP